MAGKKSNYNRMTKKSKYSKKKRNNKKKAKDYVSKVRFNGAKRIPGFNAYENLPSQVIKKAKESRKKWARTIIKRYPKFFMNTGRKKYIIDDAEGYIKGWVSPNDLIALSSLIRDDPTVVNANSISTFFISKEINMRMRIMQINNALDSFTLVNRGG